MPESPRIRDIGVKKMTYGHIILASKCLKHIFLDHCSKNLGRILIKRNFKMDSGIFHVTIRAVKKLLYVFSIVMFAEV